MSKCGSCGKRVQRDVERTVRPLLANLDELRKLALGRLYGSQKAPRVLCANCFIPALDQVNKAVFQVSEHADAG